MSENFNQIKKKFLLKAVCFSSAIGIGIGILIVGILLLIFKLTAVNLWVGYYVLVGIGAMVLSGGICFLLLRPTDKKVAKSLDEEFGLGEKVQTMVAFQGEEGDILALQRQDTNEKLRSLPKRKTKPGSIFKGLAVGVLAVTFFFAGVLVPSRHQASGETPPKPFDLSAMQRAAIAQLIGDVQKSELSENNKSATIIVLQNLSDSLETTQLDSAMRAAVFSAVAMIDKIFETANSYIAVTNKLFGSTYTVSFARDVMNGVLYYRSDGTPISDLDSVTFKWNKNEDGIKAIISEGASSFNGEFAELRGTELKNVLISYVDSLSVVRSLGLAEKDNLRFALLTIAEDLNIVVQNLSEGGYSTSALHEQIGAACNRYVTNATEACMEQAYNCMMNVFVRQRLATIFSISLNELPAVTLPDGYTDSSSGGNDEDGSHSGGGGDETSKYGSNDIIFYPVTEEYVEYGTVLNEYLKKMQEYLNSGEISDDLAKYINEYFDSLYSGIQQSK